ncbi:hypothetical protein AB1L42_22935 [Thalassoglobus sp. JC818]|uniref:HNH endonuclease n=1 Tax=Thalassoglobus sp. JC818 TaxID=3232136 RepID=UPI0034587808
MDDRKIINFQNKLRTSKIGYWYQPVYHIVFARAEYRCEYCHFDLLSSLSAYHGFWNFDHILPRSRYTKIGGPQKYGYMQTGTNYANFALACVSCNGLKSDFDPGVGIVSKDSLDLDLETRKILIERSRNWLNDRRKVLLQDFQGVQRLAAEVFGNERFSDS